MIEQFRTDLVRASALMTLAAVLLAPRHSPVWLGVAGGCLLALGLFWSVTRAVDAVLGSGPMGRGARLAALVNFFTRHAIVAAAAWFMIARLQVSAVALVAGVSTLLVAAAVQAVRARPWATTTASLPASATMPGRVTGPR